MHTFLLGAPTSWSYKSITFQENKLASGWTQSGTMYFYYRKYWKWTAPYCRNDIFMPSLNISNTRSQMTLDIPLCRTNKGQKKYVISWSKELEYVELKHKSRLSSSFLHAEFAKRNSWKIAVVRNFIDFYWQLIVFSFTIFFAFIYLVVDPDGNKNRFRSFLCHFYHLGPRSIFMVFAFFQGEATHFAGLILWLPKTWATRLHVFC